MESERFKAALRALGFEIKKEDVRRMLDDIGKDTDSLGRQSGGKRDIVSV